MLAVSPAGTAGQNLDAREYQVKAAFVYNFALYVEWPTSDTGGQKPHTVCVLGTTTVGRLLEGLSGKTVKNRRLVVRQITEIEDAGDCDILFIGTAERINLPSILEAVRTRNVLTISDMERFTHAGGMIGFVTRDNKVVFEINLKQAQRSRLRISSQLLKLARDVIE